MTTGDRTMTTGDRTMTTGDRTMTTGAHCCAQSTLSYLCCTTATSVALLRPLAMFCDVTAAVLACMPLEMALGLSCVLERGSGAAMGREPCAAWDGAGAPF